MGGMTLVRDRNGPISAVPVINPELRIGVSRAAPSAGRTHVIIHYQDERTTRTHSDIADAVQTLWHLPGSMIQRHLSNSGLDSEPKESYLHGIESPLLRGPVVR
jgi:hypothetical protein